MKAMTDAGVLVLIVVAALAIRVAPVEQPDEVSPQATPQAVLATPAVAAPVELEDNSLLLVDIEDLEPAIAAEDAQFEAVRQLESLEVGLTETELEAMTAQIGELVQAVVLGATRGPTGELLSRAAEAALEAAAPASPCRNAG